MFGIPDLSCFFFKLFKHSAIRNVGSSIEFPQAQNWPRIYHRKAGK
jgi:hypothetical protein